MNQKCAFCSQVLELMFSFWSSTWNPFEGCYAKKAARNNNCTQHDAHKYNGGVHLKKSSAAR